jgi:hypothetical protein
MTLRDLTLYIGRCSKSRGLSSRAEMPSVTAQMRPSSARSMSHMALSSEQADITCDQQQQQCAEVVAVMVQCKEREIMLVGT